MGYSTLAYAIGIERLRATFGAGDLELLRAIEDDSADDLRQHDERFADEIGRGAPTMREALRQMIVGQIPDRDVPGYPYGYALELLCKHLGQLLESDDLIAFVDDLELPTGLLDSGPPVPIPETEDFPVIGYLTADEVRDEYARLKDQDLAHDDDEIEQAREEFRSYLRQAAKRKLGIVTFAY